MSRKKSSGGTLLWALAGLGAGVALGLMVAPEKGEKIREKIKDRAREKIDDLLAAVEDSLEEAYVKAKAEEIQKASKSDN